MAEVPRLRALLAAGQSITCRVIRVDTYNTYVVVLTEICILIELATSPYIIDVMY